jgi:voltage-gated potassium channel
MPAAGQDANALLRWFPDAELVVFGHSHEPADIEGVDGQRLFNPGSASQRPRQPHRTLGRLALDEGRSHHPAGDRGRRRAVSHWHSRCPMKSLALVLSYLGRPLRQRNARVVAWLLLLFVALVATFSTVFHVLMADEGREHSWATGVYWTFTTMSTLGFGDITFESDAGRIFSVVVLVSGALFLLVLLPFAFIQFVFTPWMDRREAARAPRRLPDDVNDHIILTGLGVIEDSLIRRARQSNVPYVIIEPEMERALHTHDRGYNVMLGALDDPATYRAARVTHAALVATTQPDTTNTNIAFTVREIDPHVPVVATANSAASVDVLELAGCDEVLQLGHMLGDAMARRVLGTDARSHAIGRFGPLFIAEADVADTPFVGKTLRDARLRELCNVNVVGFWHRGRFSLADPDLPLAPDTILILAGSEDQLAAYDAHFGIDRGLDAPVVIIGGGRVGRAAGRVLSEAGIDHRIIEQRSDRIRDPARYLEGDAADLATLEAAGLRQASAVLVTTHEDDVNVYLTLYCRKLEPDIRIISRANLDRNVTTLHRAGADAVMSYASIGASAVWNTLGLDDTLVIAEGLDAIRVRMPPSLAGRTLTQAALRRRTGVNVVAVDHGGAVETNPDPDRPLPGDAELVIIGDAEAERAFLTAFPTSRPPRSARAGVITRPGEAEPAGTTARPASVEPAATTTGADDTSPTSEAGAAGAPVRTSGDPAAAAPSPPDPGPGDRTG